MFFPLPTILLLSQMYLYYENVFIFMKMLLSFHCTKISFLYHTIILYQFFLRNFMY